MKAPDKIYIWIENGIIQSVRIDDAEPSDIEYIRKDAILELAKKGLKTFDIRFGGGISIAEFIDQINSL